MRLAVTGATGFLGRHFVKAALEAGHEVRALVRPGHAAPAGARAFVGALSADIPDGFVSGADVLVHLAALGVQSRDRDWARAASVNVGGTLQLVRQAAALGVKGMVLVGTSLEYQGHGTLPDSPSEEDGARCTEESSVEANDPYGATKAAGGLLARAAAREAHVDAWYLRVASMYGESDDPAKLIPGALAAAKAGREYPISPGAQVREWLHVDDAVRALLVACDKPAPTGGAIVNVGTGEGVALLDLVRRIFVLAGADPTLVKAGARPYRRDEAHRVVMEVSRAQALLGWRPRIALDDGLRGLLGGAK